MISLDPSHGPRSFGRWIENSFWHLQDIYHELKPCRFVVIVVVIWGFVFLGVEEGREVLRALAEPGYRTGGVRLGLFAFGLMLWSLTSWYSARVLLYFDFPKTHVWHPERTGIWQRVHILLPRHVPRILGVAPMFIIGWSFLSVRGSYEHDVPSRLLGFGWLAIGSGILLYFLFILRRRWLERDRQSDAGFARIDKQVSDRADRKKFCRLMELERDSQIALAGMAATSIALALMFVFNPIFFAGAFGTGAVLMFAAASWIFWGSALVYVGSWKHVPVITLLVLWIALCSLGNDNHDVRVLKREAFQRLTLRQALVDWNSRITKKYPDSSVHPLFIVATEGGGVRAAYWTATVLGSIQDADPSFADHIFAISGVSGGSLGAAVFDALVADSAPQHEFAKRGQMILGQDFLSPAIAAMLYPDLFQRVLPLPITFFDRGRWLERGWEQAWLKTMHTDRFGKSFLDLWRDPRVYVPALFLNGTSVEVGNRIIASNVLIGADFLEAADATAKLFPLRQLDERRRPTRDMPLSTAAHMSARFTYVSPAGRFEADGSHVVDGGYFENSGAATALDILRQVNAALHQPNQLQWGRIVPQIIMISNDPLGVASGSRQMVATKELLKNTAASTAAEAAQRRPGTFLEDALAPVYALLSAREARGDYAQRAIGRAQDEFCREDVGRLGINSPKAKCNYFFSLAPATVPLPLGWMLSNRAAEAMQQEMSDLGLSEKAPVPTWNQAMLHQVVAALHGATP
jgi:hypothetical protein